MFRLLYRHFLALLKRFSWIQVQLNRYCVGITIPARSLLGLKDIEDGAGAKTNPRSPSESTGNTDTEFAVHSSGKALSARRGIASHSLSRATGTCNRARLQGMQCHASRRTPYKATWNARELFCFSPRGREEMHRREPDAHRKASEAPSSTWTSRSTSTTAQTAVTSRGKVRQERSLTKVAQEHCERLPRKLAQGHRDRLPRRLAQEHREKSRKNWHNPCQLPARE